MSLSESRGNISQALFDEIQRALNKDPLATDGNITLGKPQVFSSSCARGHTAPTIAVGLHTSEDNNRVVLITSRGKRRYATIETISPEHPLTSIVEATVHAACQRANCSGLGCASQQEHTLEKASHRRPARRKPKI